jgi:hypothetical protein
MWTYGTVQVFPQELDDTDIQEVARLTPFGGGTIHHRFGWQDPITKINAFIVGLTDRDTLRSYKEVGGIYTLSGPWGVWCSGHLKEMNSKPNSWTCQTLREDLPEDSPVFIVELQIYHD